jgi:hypothetical protein
MFVRLFMYQTYAVPIKRIYEWVTRKVLGKSVKEEILVD